MTGDDLHENEAFEREPLLYRAVHWPLAAINTLFEFALRYWFGRPWILLVSAIPAVLAALIAMGTGVWLGFQSEAGASARITRQLQAAMTAKDYARQRICLKNLMQRSPKSPEYRFQYALLLREEGKDQAGQILLEELASEDGGFRPAHRMLADEAMTRYGKATAPAEKQSLRQAAIRHLVALGQDRGPQLDYRLGMLYAEDGQLALGELQLKQSAEAGFGAAQMMLSRLQLLHGDLKAASKLREDARKSLESYISNHPEDMEARIAWARCLLDGSEWDRFTQVVSELNAQETDADYRDRLGRLALAASQMQPLTSTATVQRAIAYTRVAFPLLLDRRPAALHLMELSSQGLTIPPEAMNEVRQWLDQAITQQDGDASLWGLRGTFAELAHDPAAAKDAFERAAQLDPNFLAELAAFHRRQKNSQQLADVDNRLMKHFETRLADKPDDPSARAALAECYADQGRWDMAKKILAGTDKSPQLRMAVAALSVREFDARLAANSSATPPTNEKETPAFPPYELLRTALENVPDYAPAIARLESELDREAAGGDVLERFLLEMLANSEHPATFHRLLGLRATELKDWPSATKYFEQAVRMVPNDAFMRNNLAYSLLQAGATEEQLRRADVLATEALQLAPEHPEILATRGEIRVRLKQYDKAVADLEKTVAVLPGRAHLYELLGKCYDGLGMTPLANVYREKAHKAQPQDPRD